MVSAVRCLQLYLAQYEHLPLQLSRSSCQPLAVQELLALADSGLQQQWQQLELGYPPNVGSLQLRQVRLRNISMVENVRALAWHSLRMCNMLRQ
jgi:hypothetical protein